MRTFLTCWTLAAVLGIAVCGWYLFASAGMPAPLTHAPQPTRIEPVRTAASHEPSPRIEFKVPVPPASELARAAEVVKEDESRLGLPGSHYLALRNAERNVLRDYQFIFDAVPSLAPEAKRRIRELLREHKMLQLDASAALIKHGIAPGSREQAAFMEQMNREFDAQLMAAAGTDYAEIQRLRGLTGTMSYINWMVSPLLEYVGDPLTLEQKLQLAALIKEAHVLPGPGYSGQLEEPIDPSTGLVPAYRDLIGRAAAFLSPQQLAAVKASQDFSITSRRQRTRP